MPVQFRPFDRTALIGVDIQEDFIKDTIDQGFRPDALIDQFWREAKLVDVVVLTKSVHPADHFSFAEFGPHCVKGTKGAKINKTLLEHLDDPIITTKKSTNRQEESYSAFESETLRPKLDLEHILADEYIGHIWIAGMGHGWDVPQTAYDASALKYDVTVKWSLPHLWPAEMTKMDEMGVTIL